MSEQALPARFFFVSMQKPVLLLCGLCGLPTVDGFVYCFQLFSKINRKIFGGYKKKRYFCIAIKDCALIGRLAQLV